MAGAGPRAAAQPVRRAGPNNARLDQLTTIFAAAPPVQRLQALSHVVQRVIRPAGAEDEPAAVRERLVGLGVPGPVVDNYQALHATYTEAEVRRGYTGANLGAGAALRDVMQSSFPKLVRTVDDNTEAADDLIYRGMSINNVKNLKNDAADDEHGDGVIFNAQNPLGEIGPVGHIVDDDPQSPYLSFEAGGFDISGGKYAAKPLGPENSKPRGVSLKDGDFLKQKQSYTGQSRLDYPDSRRVGYIAGVDPAAVETLDVSTPELAAENLHDGDADREATARRIAVNDREVLAKPGEAGIRRSQVPVIVKVKEISREAYLANRTRQTPTKAFGFFKPMGRTAAKTLYYRVEIPAHYNPVGNYRFEIPDHLRQPEDDEGEVLSDAESVDLDLEDQDYSGDEAEEEEALAHGGGGVQQDGGAQPGGDVQQGDGLQEQQVAALLLQVEGAHGDAQQNVGDQPVNAE